MDVLKALLIALILLLAGGGHDWGYGKWYGGGWYAFWGMVAAIGVLLVYLAFTR